MSIPLKHHYLPVFYQNRWTGDDERLCEFSRPRNEIVAKRKHPAQTGYQERLYETPGVEPDKAQVVEQQFMQRTDSAAAEALVMLENNDSKLTTDSKARSAWSRFLMTQMMRSPRDIEALKNSVAAQWDRFVPELKEKYEKTKGKNDPATFDEWMDTSSPEEAERIAMQLVTRLMDHAKIGDLLNNMRWFIQRISSDVGEFYTCDNPIMTTLTLKERNAYLTVPIGPKALFCAVNDVETQRAILNRDPDTLVKKNNEYVVGRAQRFAYSCTDEALPFMQKYFGVHPRTTLLEQLAAYQKKKRD